MKKVGALGGWLAVFCVASTSSLDVRGDDAAVAEWGYSVTVDGRPVEVVEIPAPVHNLRGGNAQPYAYAQFDIAKESVVRGGGRKRRLPCAEVVPGEDAESRSPRGVVPHEAVESAGV